MAPTATLDLRGGRLQLVADDDDFTVVTLRVPFDPTESSWLCLWRDRNVGGDFGEFTVTASGTENEGDLAGTWNLEIEVDTADFGEAARVWCLFRGTDPWISGPLITQATPERTEP